MEDKSKTQDSIFQHIIWLMKKRSITQDRVRGLFLVMQGLEVQVGITKNIIEQAKECGNDSTVVMAEQNLKVLTYWLTETRRAWLGELGQRKEKSKCKKKRLCRQ